MLVGEMMIIIWALLYTMTTSLLCGLSIHHHSTIIPLYVDPAVSGASVPNMFIIGNFSAKGDQRIFCLTWSCSIALRKVLLSSCQNNLQGFYTSLHSTMSLTIILNAQQGTSTTLPLYTSMYLCIFLCTKLTTITVWSLVYDSLPL